MANYGLFSILHDFIFFWTKTSAKYNRLKENETKRPVSVTLGVESILHSIFYAIIIVLSMFGIKACFGHLSSSTPTLPILTLIGIILCIGIAIVSLIQGMLGAMMYWIYQLKLNKKPIGYVAMAIWIVCLIAAIGISIFILASA